MLFFVLCHNSFLRNALAEGDLDTLDWNCTANEEGAAELLHKFVSEFYKKLPDTPSDAELLENYISVNEKLDAGSAWKSQIPSSDFLLKIRQYAFYREYVYIQDLLNCVNTMPAVSSPLRLLKELHTAPILSRLMFFIRDLINTLNYNNNKLNVVSMLPLCSQNNKEYYKNIIEKLTKAKSAAGKFSLMHFIADSLCKGHDNVNMLNNATAVNSVTSTTPNAGRPNAVSLISQLCELAEKLKERDDIMRIRDQIQSFQAEFAKVSCQLSRVENMDTAVQNGPHKDLFQTYTQTVLRGRNGILLLTKIRNELELDLKVLWEHLGCDGVPDFELILTAITGLIDAVLLANDEVKSNSITRNSTTPHSVTAPQFKIPSPSKGGLSMQAIIATVHFKAPLREDDREVIHHIIIIEYTSFNAPQQLFINPFYYNRWNGKTRA